ncbi:serine/threonine-protein kinase [Streptomonospora wellingtoniae]|uniref:non-specific serine/threonine protein kinase n=1 Tax=Streptomonospora wellingtoniae TaxID=3075544 RepID=A0ABU2KUX5_9ACTN|nr:protein kinase [Streptomonospora sp. DSM 45055]MDT0302858.1 protein kinase [Streptomonospora sp. DSM 45055]
MSEGGTGNSERYAGRYRLIEPLGRGGFGEVFLAEGPDGTRAAVKLLHATWAGDGDMRRRFAAEVEQARRVSGFCVAAILDADPGAEQPWIAAEYIDGPTLEADVRANGPRRGADLHRLAVATATALAAIHGAGVVHRDLKPDNILLAGDGPRVIDFGIARAIEATSMTASGIVGTIGYMAPEQLEGARLTPAVDVFAWGAAMVYAATGREAFAAPTQAARTTRVLTGEPDTGDLGEPLLPAVLACLDKDPARRPEARALLDVLLGTSTPEAPGERVGAGRAPAQREESARVAAEAATRVGSEERTRVEDARDGATRVETARADAAHASPAQDADRRSAGRTEDLEERGEGGGPAYGSGTLLYTSLGPGGTRAAPRSAPQAPGPPPQAVPQGPAGPTGASYSPAPPGSASPGSASPGSASPGSASPGSASPGSASPAPASDEFRARNSEPPAPPPGRTGAPADVDRGGFEGVPPYWFAGHRCTGPGALAAAMQADWTAAVGVFSDEQERAALQAWMVDDVGDTSTDRSIFRRRPDDANRAVAWFVAQQRPDLPPVFRGRPAGLADLRERSAQVRPAFTGAPPDNELLLLARPEVLRLLALHDDPGSADLRRLADDLAAAERAASAFRRQLEDAVPRLAQHAAVDSALILSLLMAPDRPMRPDAGGHAEAEEWYAALWGAVEREPDPAARAGIAATVASLTGAARESGVRTAEWRSALAEADREREAAAARWTRESRLQRAKVWVGRSPLVVLVLAAAVVALGAAAGSDVPDSYDAVRLGIIVLGTWLLSRVVAWGVGLFSGPRDGFPSAVQAAQARYHQLRDHAERLGHGLEHIRAELQAVRSACDL